MRQNLSLVLAALPALCAHLALANPPQPLPAPPPSHKTLKVQPNTENVVASELFGPWVYSPALGPSAANPPIAKLVFKDDPDTARKTLDALAVILERLSMTRAVTPQQALLRDTLRSIYLAGAVEITTKEGKTLAMGFALVSLHGNPHLLLLEPTTGNLESANIMLARDLQGDRDILFLGSAFNDQSFSTYTRILR